MNKKVATYSVGFLAGIIATIVFNTVFGSLFLVTPSKAMQRKVDLIYQILDKNFINGYDKSELEDYMYTGMVLGLGDPYTSYMNQETYKDFMEQTEGVFAGIGVSVEVDPKDNRIVVVTPYEGYPGANAGILPGDKIMKVNGQDVSGEKLQEAVNQIKGSPGTKVSLTIYRETDRETYDYEIKRENIELPTVFHRMMSDQIGYIRITRFEGVTSNQFLKAYEELKKDNMKGLVIDLRNNPGGLLHEVVKITDQLIPEGNIVYTEDKNGKKEYHKSDANRIEVPLAIIVNGNSASASEVLSGAVKDTGVGVLVGTKTYGKGVVQALFKLFDQSAVKVTIAKYYTPNGICIDGEGIPPDYEVEMDEALSIKIQSLTLDEDVQLKKAIEVIQDQIQ